MSDIPKSPYWQLSLDEPFEVVTDIDDIRQCLIVILRTAKGSDPLRPDFGADIYKAIDLPNARVAPLLKKSILDQVAQYEPRVEVLGIALTVKGESHISITLEWTAKADALAAIQNLYAEFLR